MTTIEVTDRPATSAKRQLKLGWTLMVAVLVALATVLVIVVLNQQDGKYGPIESGGFYGPLLQRAIVPVGGSEDGLYRLAGSGNQSAYYYSSLSNAGEHSVKVTSIDTDDVTVKAQWAPMPTSNTVPVPQKNARWRDFPAIVGDSTIQLRYEIRRPPRCQGRPMTPGSGQFYSDTHTVHWESLLGDRTSTIGFDSPSFNIQVC